MKKVLIAMSVIAFAFGSCTKTNLQSTSTQITPNTTDAAHYYSNGQQVHTLQDVSQLGRYGSSVVVTDQLGEGLSYYFFDNADQAASFVGSHAALTPLYEKIQQSNTLRAYAESVHEDDYVAAHGNNSEAFANYLRPLRTRAYPFALFTGVSYSGTSYGVTGPTPVLAAGINNNSQSMRSGSGLPVNLTMYDLINFNPAAGSVFIYVASVPNLGGFGWAVRISSVN